MSGALDAPSLEPRVALATPGGGLSDQTLSYQRIDISVPVRKRRPHIATRLLFAAALCGVPALPASAAQQPKFTWSGGAAVGGARFMNWSTGANWIGGIAPAQAAGTLSFPRLTTGTCATTSPTETCRSSFDDLAGLSVGRIAIADDAGYSLGGNAEAPLLLGSGGIHAYPMGVCTRATPCPDGTAFGFPIALGSSQTWSIAGDGTFGLIGVEDFGGVSGTGHALRVRLRAGASLELGGDDEVGPVTIAGTDQAVPQRNGMVTLVPDRSGAPASLNGTDANPVTVSAATFYAQNATVGPLHASHALIGSAGLDPPGRLMVNGALTLDRSSALAFTFARAGAQAGEDYSQIDATGTVALAGAGLSLGVSDAHGSAPTGPSCPALTPGDVDRLMTTTGRIVGELDAADVTLIRCTSGIVPAVRLRYTRHALEAIVLPLRGGVTVPDRTVPVGAGYPPSGYLTLACRGPVNCAGHFELTASVGHERSLAISYRVSYGLSDGTVFPEVFTLLPAARSLLRAKRSELHATVTLTPSNGEPFRSRVTLQKVN